MPKKRWLDSRRSRYIPTTGGAGYIPPSFSNSGNLPKSVSEVRHRLYKHINPNLPYTTDVIKGALDAILLDQVRDDLKYDYKWYRSLQHDDFNDIDAIYGQYLNIPKNERYSKHQLQKSKYKPSIGGENEEYYKLSLSKRLLDDFVDYTLNRVRPNSNEISAYFASKNLGNHTIGRGIDNNGEYISYYDKWDLNPFNGAGTMGNLPIVINKGSGDVSMGIGKPVNIYDRIYLNDYFGVPSTTRGTYLPEIVVLGRKSLKYGGTIHIKPENRGKFNALKKRTGKTTEELTHSKNPLTRKRAIFAQNARKWNHKKK